MLRALSGHETVAQLVEHATFNRVVMGSNPIGLTNFKAPAALRQATWRASLGALGARRDAFSRFQLWSDGAECPRESGAVRLPGVTP